MRARTESWQVEFDSVRETNEKRPLIQAATNC